MIFSHRYRHIFIHVPKTGGTSLYAQILSQSEGLEQSAKPPWYGFFSAHYTVAQIAQILSKDTFDECYKWAVVRNPYDRFISLYYWNMYVNRWQSKLDLITDDINKFTEDIDRYVLDDVTHKLPQYDFVNIDGQLVCDIYRYEDGLDSVIHAVSEKIHNHHLVGGLGVGGERGTRFPIITKLDRHEYAHIRQNRRPYYEVLSAQSMRIIEEKYADDFRLFGYAKYE